MKDSLKQDFAQSLSGIFLVLVLTAASALTFAVAWGLVDWMRNFGTGLAPLPFLDHGCLQTDTFRRFPAGSFCGVTEDLINWYNVTFCNALRFGSGLGIIGGAFFALSFVRHLGLTARIIAGFMAGALIGARSIMMVTSDVPFFFAGLCLGGVFVGVYMSLSGDTPRVPPLPPFKLGKSPPAL